MKKLIEKLKSLFKSKEEELGHKPKEIKIAKKKVKNKAKTLIKKAKKK
jgi:hypothetical protein